MQLAPSRRPETNNSRSEVNLKNLQQLYPQFMSLLFERSEELCRNTPIQAAERGTDLVALAHSKANELREIREAVERIRNRSYGICEECEAVIPVARLISRPQTRLCVNCQSEIERTCLIRGRSKNDFITFRGN